LNNTTLKESKDKLNKINNNNMNSTKNTDKSTNIESKNKSLSRDNSESRIPRLTNNVSSTSKKLKENAESFQVDISLNKTTNSIYNSSNTNDINNYSSIESNNSIKSKFTSLNVNDLLCSPKSIHKSDTKILIDNNEIPEIIEMNRFQTNQKEIIIDENDKN